MTSSIARFAMAGTVAALAGAAPAAHGGILLSENFASSSVLCSTAAALGTTCNWYGAQHGVLGPSGAFGWTSGLGGDGQSGFVGYSPTTRAGVTLFTSGFGSVAFGSLQSISIDSKNTNASAGGGQPSEGVKLALRSGNQWYVSDTGFAPTGDWQTLVFATLGAQDFQAFSTDGVTPQLATGAAAPLAGSTTIDAIGFFTGWSGQNNPNSGFVLRYDNFKVETTAVPEPGSLALAALALGGLALSRRQRPRA